MKPNQDNKQMNEDKKNIDRIQKEILKKEKELIAKEKSIVVKTTAVDLKQKELKEKAATLESELSTVKSEKQQLDKELSKLETLQKNLATKEAQLEKDRIQLEHSAPQKIENYKQALDENHQQRSNDLASYKKSLEKKERELAAAQQKFQTEQEQHALRMHSFDRECTEQLNQKKIALSNEQRMQRETYNQDLMAARDEAFEKLSNELQAKRKKLELELQSQREKLETDQHTVKESQAETQRIVADYKIKAQALQAKQAALEKLVDERALEHSESLERTILQKENEITRLRDSLENSELSLSLYKDLKQQLGDTEPARVLSELAARQEELNRLNEELLERPAKEIQDYYDAAKIELESEKERAEKFQAKNHQLLDEVSHAEQTRYELSRVNSELESLQALFCSKEAENNKLKTEIEHLNVSYNSEINRDERLKQIQTGVISRPELKAWPKNINEVSWLKTIQNNISDYGLQFDARILFSFHTALKIAEWSPLTVLAGVSGTGKSELPKLYSHFGGINFLSVPVQPNWDSQESMLGYFNAIDNVFDAQPVLKFLIQSQMEQSDNPIGLNDMMNLVLLDEMNLAHVEMYFADFLSKLEQRRGSAKDKLPSLDIKLGAKHEPYELPLGRNMLFTGTMNQDETTKALSDKVLDRGVTIYFPRPTSLVARKKLKVIKAPEHYMSTIQWKKWVKFESQLPDKEQKSYKGIIEQINNHLGEIGKALGHRVWQSIEYFMVNHPLVMALASNGSDDLEYQRALHFAFEDQLVQKVMPKLRGIETRGIGKDRCLSPIRNLLDEQKFNLVADFDRAMIMGHGQFMWCSADYLNDPDSKKEYELLIKSISSASKKAQVANEDKPTEAKQKKVSKANKTPPTKKTETAKKFIPTLEQLSTLGLHASHQSQQITDLTIDDIKKCINVTGFEAKDVIAYLKDNAPKAGV